MKLKPFLAIVTASIVIGGSLQAANVAFHVDPSATWNQFVNAYNVSDNTSPFGFPEGNPSTMSANFAAGPAQPLTLGPNTRIYDQEILNAAWVDQITFEPILYIQANYYQETGFGSVAPGDTWSFQGAVTTSNLGTSPWTTGPQGYSGVAFLKVLDPDGGWATTQVLTTPLVPGQGFFLQDTVPTVPSGGNPFIQAGFALTGPIVSANDPIAGTGINIIPEPTTFALAGLGAAALVIFRRRS